MLFPPLFPEIKSSDSQRDYFQDWNTSLVRMERALPFIVLTYYANIGRAVLRPEVEQREADTARKFMNAITTILPTNVSYCTTSCFVALTIQVPVIKLNVFKLKRNIIIELADQIGPLMMKVGRCFITPVSFTLI